MYLFFNHNFCHEKEAFLSFVLGREMSSSWLKRIIELCVCLLQDVNFSRLRTGQYRNFSIYLSYTFLLSNDTWYTQGTHSIMMPRYMNERNYGGKNVILNLEKVMKLYNSLTHLSRLWHSFTQQRYSSAHWPSEMQKGTCSFRTNENQPIREKL